jgi:hypothetical protein
LRDEESENTVPGELPVLVNDESEQLSHIETRDRDIPVGTVVTGSDGLQLISSDGHHTSLVTN